MKKAIKSEIHSIETCEGVDMTNLKALLDTQEKEHQEYCDEIVKQGNMALDKELVEQKEKMINEVKKMAKEMVEEFGTMNKEVIERITGVKLK